MNNGLDVITLTKKLIEFNTINPPGNEAECANYIAGILNNFGFEVNLYEFENKRTNIIAKLHGESDQLPICFSGHIDTVPLGNAVWTKSSIPGEIVGDKLYGRGSSDMKAGLAAMITAACNISENSKLHTGITLIITAAEETGCIGAQSISKFEDILGKAGALVVCEASSNIPFLGHKGTLWLQASASGVTAHGSMPEQGVNAIYKICDSVQKLKDYNFKIKPHFLLGPPTLNVGTISGGINVNSVPDKAEIGIDIRTIPEQKNEQVFNDFKEFLGTDTLVEKIIDVEGFYNDSNHEWIKQVYSIIEKKTGKKPEPKGITYFTDGAVLKPALGNPPTIILGPGEPDMNHKTDEFCYIPKIKQAVEIYSEIIRRWCCKL